MLCSMLEERNSQSTSNSIVSLTPSLPRVKSVVIIVLKEARSTVQFYFQMIIFLCPFCIGQMKSQLNEHFLCVFGKFMHQSL